MTATDPMKQIEAFAADTQKTLTDTVGKATKSLEGLAAFNQETMDAMIKSQNLAAKAAEELNAEVVAFSKKTVEETVAHAKELAAVQTVTEFVEKQAAYAKLSLDASVKQTAKINEMMVGAMKGVFEPMQARLHAAVDIIKTQTAA
jgi:phasin family protein